MEEFLQQLTANITIVRASFSETKAVFHLNDGRDIACPLEWFPRLANANDKDRAKYKIETEGRSIHWPKLDEDLSLRGLFTYSPRRGELPQKETGSEQKIGSQKK